MDKEEFKNFIETESKLNYIKDAYGNYKATDSRGNVFRYKIQANSVRHEVQLSYENFDGKTEKYWNKRWSEYFKNLEINPETGGLRRIKK